MLLWSQCSAKAMVLKWPYAFQISRFVNHIIITGMGFQTALSCLGAFAKGTRALRKKILPWCASPTEFTLLFSILPCPRRHSSPALPTLLPPGQCLCLPGGDIYPHSVVLTTLAMPHAFAMRLAALGRRHRPTNNAARLPPATPDADRSYLVYWVPSEHITPVFNHKPRLIRFCLRRVFHFLRSLFHASILCRFSFHFCGILKEAAESPTENALCNHSTPKGLSYPLIFLQGRKDVLKLPHTI